MAPASPEHAKEIAMKYLIQIYLNDSMAQIANLPEDE